MLERRTCVRITIEILNEDMDNLPYQGIYNSVRWMYDVSKVHGTVRERERE